MTKLQPGKTIQVARTKSSRFRQRLWDTTKSAFLSVALGILVMCILLSIKIVFEKSDAGHKWEQWIYGKFNIYTLSTSEFDIHSDSPVVVVDIKALEPRLNYIGGENITPRPELIELLQAIADAKPRAIGLDVDMGPLESNKNEMPKEDREFFKVCDAIRHRQPAIPVIVAVGERSQFGTKEQRLGAVEFNHLAASSFIPKTESRCLPLRFEGADGDEVWGFAAALVAAAGEPIPTFSGHESFEKLIELIPDTPGDSWKMEAYWMDYSFLRHPKIVTGYSPAIVKEAPWLFKDKFVLIGDVHLASDTVVVHGVSDSPVAGVLIHACGVDALLKGAISQPSHLVRLLLDVLLAGGVILALSLIRLFVFTKERKDILNQHSVHWILTISTILVITVSAHWLAWHYRILWTDAILVALALVIHAPVEKYMLGFFKLIGHQSTTQPQTHHESHG